MPRIKIADRWVGAGCPPFIIAEAGVNHNGSLDKAFEMIRLAKKAGADAVKFQTYKAKELFGDPAQTYTYRSQGREITEPMGELLRRYELPDEAWAKLKAACDREGVVFLSTPQNRSDLDLLIAAGAPAIKVGSDDFTYLSQLKNFASTGLPMIVSSGMADLAEIHQSLEAIGALDGYPTVLLLCVSLYPAPHEEVNLLRLRTLAQAFPMVPVGFSDHTQGPLASSLAVALGACVLEKHFTLDHDLPGPDHWFSEDPQGLTAWVESVRKTETILGSPVVRCPPAEEKMKVTARRSILALRDIQAGETLTAETIGLMRPGSGLPPALLQQVLGRKAVRPISRGSPILFGDFA